MVDHIKDPYPSAAGRRHCHVLVVDDDRACVEEYCEILDSLGYRSARSTDARAALRLLADDPQIGIVITDLQMPGMDGLSFLEELSARFALIRPIVAVVITSFGSLDTAVEAMRLNAVDFLSKPTSRDALAVALRRASQRWAQQVGQMRLAAMTNLARGVDPGADIDGSDFAGPEPTTPSSPPARKKLLGFVRSIVRSRQRRADFLDTDLFADPAWDILLDLTCAELEGKTVPVSSACIAAQVPMTTALRYIQQLEDAGLVRRWKDPSDRRRNFLELADTTKAAMLQYLTAIMRQRRSAP